MRRIAVCMLATLGMLIAAGTGATQAAGSAGGSREKKNDLTQIAIEDLMDVQVTTAAKKAESMAQTPASVFVITREDIERYGYRTLADSLRQVAGMYVSSDRDYQYLGVRGFASPDDYDKRVLLLINGHKLNEIVYDYAALGEDFPLNMESIQRIEVVKGPGSALWGTNALLAVINVVTRTAQDINGLRLSSQYGSNSSAKGFAEYGIADGNGLSIAASASTLKSDGRDSIYYPEFDDPATNNGLATGADGEQAVKGYLQASYRGLSFIYNQGKRTRDVSTAPYGAAFNSKPAFTTDRRSFAELSYDGNADNKHNAKVFARVYMDETQYVGDFMYDWPPLILNRDYSTARWYGAEARYSCDFSSRLSSVFGMEYIKAAKAERGNFDPEPYAQYYSSSTTPHVYSGYLQLEYDLHSALRLVAGTRMDCYSTFGSHWSPRAALVYTPTARQSFKLLYGTAFRAPTDSELYGVDLPNLGLQPERVATSELVWEALLGANTRLVTSIFRFDLRDIINPVAVGENYQMQNEGAVKSSGVEVQLESRFSNDMRGYLGLSATRATEAGGAITNSPHTILTAGLSVPVWSDRLYLTPDVTFISDRKTVSGGTTGANTQFNLSVRTVRPYRDLDISLGVYNLMNSSLYSPGGTGHTQNRIAQDPRTMQLQISRSF